MNRHGARASATQKSYRHETHISALEAAPRAQTRIPQSHAISRRAESAFGAPRQGPFAALGLTGIGRPGEKGSARYRLRGAGAFAAVFRAGRRFDGRYLQLVAAAAKYCPGRVGYVIGGKSVPRAVDRNRLRRRLRETIRAARPAIQRYDVIVRVKRPVPPNDIGTAAAEGGQLVRKLLDTPSQ